MTTAETTTMNVAITGATGLVGKAWANLDGNRSIVRLVRRAPTSESEIRWDPYRSVSDVDRLSGLDAVIHLAGENIGEGRWSESKKNRIRDSRVEGTKTLCNALASLEQPPQVLVCASATGYYGDRGDEVLDESSAPGAGFLPEVCREWEAATSAAADAGIRVVNLRTGVVLSGAGGALQKMLLPFKMGVGGKIGTGRQYWSWIHLTDLARVIDFAITNTDLSGPVNAVAPEPVTNVEFTKALGRVLGRPTVVPMPAFAAKLALGEMADDLLFASTRVVPKRLMEAGFAYEFGDLESALRNALE